jgi:hypothetical protein
MKWQHLITTIGCLHTFTSLTTQSVFPYCWTCKKWIKPLLINWQKILFLHLSRVWRCDWHWPSPKGHLFWSRWNHYFSGLKNRCDYSTHSKWWSISQWCALHGTPHKLTITTLISLRLVSKVENPTCWNYNNFAHILKHHIEFNRLIELLEFKGNKLLKTMKTQWILVLPCKRIFFKYKLLVVKMVENNGHIENANANYELLCDIEMLLGLACI